jgi:hypothetical protein
MKKRLDTAFVRKAQSCIDLINRYKKINIDLKMTPRQQWHVHNPNLQANYFDEIDTVEKGFWFGLLCADGYIRYHPPKDYSVGLEVAYRDKKIIFDFCSTLGVDPKFIYNREKIVSTGAVVPIVGIDFGCKPMVEALLRNGIFGFKASRKSLPVFFKFSTNRGVVLGWLRGYYEGDGVATSTSIVAANKQFLVHIRKFFKIKYQIRISSKYRVFFDIDRNFHIYRTTYRLSLGANIFNEMTSVCKSHGIPLINRKDHIASDHYEVFNRIKDQLIMSGINRLKFQELVFNYRKYEMQKMFGVSKYLLNKIIDEWDIDTPPRDY